MDFQKNKILIVDDEPQDIEDLEAVLDESLFKVWGTIGAREYAGNPMEALEILKRDMSHGRMYSAIISDNHMDYICGDDFLRIISGNLHYCYDSNPLDASIENFKTFPDLQRYLLGHIHEDQISEFMEEFEDFQEYKDFTKYYFESQKPPVLVLWCGSPSEANLTGLEYMVKPFQKPPRHEDNDSRPSELSVLDYLITQGVFQRENICEAMTNNSKLRSYVYAFN